MGGTGALLQLAKNQLGAETMGTLTSALGMESAMIQQFVPILMSFLGDQGVGSSMLGQLQSLWAPAG